MKNQSFKPGQYSGKIEDKVAINGSLVTRTYYTPNSNPDWHYHENMHIVFVFQNGLSQTKRRSVYTDHKGQLIFFHAGEIHRYLSTETISKSANIELSKEFMKAYNISEHEIFHNLKNMDTAKSIMLNIQSELINKESNYQEHILALLLEFITTPDIVPKSLPRWSVQLHEILNDHWNQDFSLDQLSTMLNVHPVTISKKFRSYYGCTLGEYKRKIRVERSIDFIRNRDLSLSEIAHYCGFSDQSHFIRNFKAQTKLLPSFYRAL